MKYTKCTKCNNIISNNNYKKHQESCNGNYIKFIKSDRCQHCHKTWEELGLNMIKGDNGNHSLWCEKNPRKNEYKENIKKIKYTGDQIKKRNKSIEEAWKKGAYKNVDFGSGFRGKSHSEESKRKIQIYAKNKIIN